MRIFAPMTDTELKIRLLGFQARLPRQYVKVFVKKYPKYNTEKGKNLIRAVVNLRAVDEDVITKLEKIAL